MARFNAVSHPQKLAHERNSLAQSSNLHTIGNGVFKDAAFTSTQFKKRKVFAQQRTDRDGRMQVSSAQIEDDRKSAIVLAQNEWRLRHARRQPQRPPGREDVGLLKMKESDTGKTMDALHSDRAAAVGLTR